jgi:hypothetical protein
MTTPLLERVARAICAVLLAAKYQGISGELTDRVVDRSWRDYIPEARASIQAMRELDDDTITVACDAGDLYRIDYVRAHEAMIDEALRGATC